MSDATLRRALIGLVIAAPTILTGCLQLQTIREQPADTASAEPVAPVVSRSAALTADLIPPPAPPSTEQALTADTTPPPPEDAWARLRRGFQMPLVEHERVTDNLRYYARHPGYIKRVAERARPFLHYILEAVEARDIPTEIALLPAVESAYRPYAYSHGRAAGLWQFVPATGRHYGLDQNWWYDGRRDVVAATRAALDYLERLHEYFGDWQLALAAYNAGEGTVLSAVRANERRGRPTDYWSLDLPRETEGYVPRLLALREIFRNPGHFGIELPAVPNEPYLEVVEPDSQIDLALAADMAGMSMEDFYQLNPGYNRWATAPDGPHRLLLPRENAGKLRAGLAELPKKARVEWRRHKVRPGQTLIGIANQYRTTVDVIKDTNSLRGHVIRAGDHLLIPVSRAPAGHYALSESQRQKALRNRQRSGTKHEYTVRRGDSFWAIARRYDVGVRELAKWNGMAPGDPLRPGQELVIWSDSGNAATRGGPANKLQSVRYTVRQGDSLYAIANRFNVSVQALRRWNDLPKGRYLQPGQTLRMQVDVTAQADST